MNEYKSHIALELQAASINQERLQQLSMSSFAFVRNTFEDLDTPAWVLIINFCALDILGNERGGYRGVVLLTPYNHGQDYEQAYFGVIQPIFYFFIYLQEENYENTIMKTLYKLPFNFVETVIFGMLTPNDTKMLEKVETFTSHYGYMYG